MLRILAIVSFLSVQLSFSQAVVAEALDVVVQVLRMRRVTCAGVVYRDGLILTASHCLEGAFSDTISVSFRSGASRQAVLANSSSGYDLAFLRADTQLSRPVRIATWHYVGQRVFVVGHPYGIPWVVASGILSQAFEDEIFETPSPNPGSPIKYGSLRRHLFASDAVSRQGVSGGGWFDEYGRLLAIHVLGLRDEDGQYLSVGVGYPTLERYFREVVKQ
jgi:S1-C subfamily serine protease